MGRNTKRKVEKSLCTKFFNKMEKRKKNVSHKKKIVKNLRKMFQVAKKRKSLLSSAAGDVEALTTRKL
jgi:hypothetical protein